jgi:endogenous inhibitor of DNA gyrase (YacG/DUF329 family)
MLNFRWYQATCPACQKPIDILPPDSIVAEDRVLAHRCPLCGRWLATHIVRGSRRHPELRVIETELAAQDCLPLLKHRNG